MSENQNQFASLPRGWKWVKLGEIADVTYGKTLPKKEFTEEGFPVFGANGVIGHYKNYHYPEEKLLISCRGANSGKINMSPKQAFITNNSLIINFKENDEILRKTYFYFLQAIDRSSLITGSAQPQVTIAKVIELLVPLPPLNEQRRIVAKIEELFSQLDAGVAALEAARAQLKRYRQALLKAAFEGRLTEEWRRALAGEQEPADALLARIRAEREARAQAQLRAWEQAVQAWEAAGKPGKKPRKPRKPKDLPPLTEEERAALPELPGGWAWVRAGVLFESVTSGSRGWAKYYADSGAIFIRITNLDFDSLELDLTPEKMKYVQPPESIEGTRTKVEKGDFLFSITGYLGMFAIVPQIGEAYVNQHIALARPLDGFNKKYVGYFIISESGGRYFLNERRKGAVKAGLTLDDIQLFPIPISPFTEQEKIVELLDERLSIVDNLDNVISRALEQSAALRQAILKRAFEGRLVASS